MGRSPAIAVDFFGASFFKSDQLKDLLEIKAQLVSLNLDKMPVTDNASADTIGQLDQSSQSKSFFQQGHRRWIVISGFFKSFKKYFSYKYLNKKR